MIKLSKDMLDKDQKYFVGVSGGVDSISSIHFLKKIGYNVEAFHVNHKMIKEDDYMEESISEFCVKNKIQLTTYSPKNVVNKTTSKEENARAIRIEGWNKLAKSMNQHIVGILGHHSGDVTEAYLMRCFSGKPEYIPIPFSTNFGVFTLVRPFLFTDKEDFVKHAKTHDLMKYVIEDPLNSGSRRGFIRNELMPVLTKEWRGIKKTALNRQKSFLAKDLL